MSEWAYVDGHWLPLAEAVVPLDDRGFAIGELLFESVLVRDGVTPFWPAHWRRLSRALAAFSFDRAVVAQQIRGLLAGLPPGAGRRALRINVSRGPYRGLRFNEGVTRVTATLRAVPAPRSISVGPWPARRASIDSLPLGIKHNGYLPAVWALQHSRCDDVVMLNHRGLVAELTTSNLYVIEGRKLLTPALAEGPLPGVARGLVMRAARREGLVVQEVAVAPLRLRKCSEAFASSATRGIVAIHELLGRRLPAPGPITARLQARYERVESAAVAKVEP